MNRGKRKPSFAERLGDALEVLMGAIFLIGLLALFIIFLYRWTLQTIISILVLIALLFIIDFFINKYL
ncbi:hypothetical protein [Pseudobutyrivibrio sp.]